MAKSRRHHLPVLFCADEKSMAIARLDVDKAVQGTKLEVRGKTLTASAIAHTLPFDDPEKKKRTAVG